MSEDLGSVLMDVIAHAGKAWATGKEVPMDWSGNSDLIRRRTIEILNDGNVLREDRFHRNKHLCESPIEGLALATLVTLFPEAEVAETKEALKEIEEWTVAVIPQMPFKGYRLDFGVLHRPTKGFYTVECDGREFHRHRRREDADRDVNLWRHGCIAFHVSGSALCRNPRLALEPFAEKVRGQHGRKTLV